jgi:GT2 family glycosyltransferase
MARWDVHTPREVEVIHGACLIIRRTSLPQGSALLDERYFMYTEEIDLCYRLATAGWKLNWIPEARVTHFGGASSRQAYDKMYVQLYRSKVQFYRKFGGEARARRFKSLVKLAYWPRYAAARLAQTFWRSTSSRAQTFNQLLIELPEM